MKREAVDKIAAQINDGDYALAFLGQRYLAQTLSADKLSLMNAYLRRETADKYDNFVDYVLCSRNGFERTLMYEKFANMLPGKLLNRDELLELCDTMGVPRYHVRKGADGALFSLPDTQQRASRVMYGSTEHIMHQQYQSSMTYHIEEKMIGWWRGVDARDVAEDGQLTDVLNAAIVLLANSVSPRPDSKLSGYGFHALPKRGISLTVVPVDNEAITDHWVTL